MVIIDKPRTVYGNLALNHACLDAVGNGQYEEIVRIYQFSRPGAILSSHQDIWDIREEARGTLDITRRPTGGSVVLVDEQTIGYSVFLKTGSKIDIPNVYRTFTERVITALQSYGIPDITLGHWYVKVNGGVVAGHAQQNRGFISEFQGLIRLTAWDMALLEKTVRLRTLAEHDGKQYLIVDKGAYDLKGRLVDVPLERLTRVRDEYAELAAAPSLTTYGVTHSDLMERLATALAESDERHTLPQELLVKGAQHEQHYRDPSWVCKQDGDITRCLGHCFVDMVEREPANATKPL